MEQTDMQQPQKVVMTDNYVAHGDLLEKIRPDDIVETIKRRLMGQEWTNGQWIVKPELAKDSLTEKGAFEIATIMLSASSQNVSISKLSDVEIRLRTRAIVKTVMQMCLRNWRAYGISGSDRYYFIKDIVHSNTFVTLKQPEGAGIQKLIGGTHDVRLSESEGQAPSVWDKVLRN